MSLDYFKIPSTKAGAMSYLLMLVSSGYRFWTRGEMHYSKAIGFANKINELYNVQATQSQRALMKKKGIAAVQLVMINDSKNPNKVIFWILATPGKGIINEREKLKDALTSPLTLHNQYELTKVQKTREHGSKIVWTWRMQAEYFKEQLAMSKSCADGGEQAIKDYYGRIKHMPMFSGVREQVQQLLDNSKKTWEKRRKSDFPEVISNPLPYMPKIEVFKGLHLDMLIKTMAEKEEEQIQLEKKLASELLDPDL